MIKKILEYASPEYCLSKHTPRQCNTLDGEFFILVEWLTKAREYSSFMSDVGGIIVISEPMLHPHMHSEVHPKMCQQTMDPTEQKLH